MNSFAWIVTGDRNPNGLKQWCSQPQSDSRVHIFSVPLVIQAGYRLIATSMSFYIHLFKSFIRAFIKIYCFEKCTARLN